jgi:hypothetical protein
LESILRRRIYLASLLSEDGAYFFGVMLLVLLFIVLSAGSDLQAHAQVTSAYVSLEQLDLPDAPSPPPTPQQSFQTHLLTPVLQLEGPSPGAPNLAASRDGQTLWSFQQQARHSSLAMAENFQ